MELTAEPGRASASARKLQDVQGAWEDTLAQGRREIPLAAFGNGLRSQGAQLVDLVHRGHEVRMAHARRLRDAGGDGDALIQQVSRADADSAQVMGGGLR